MKNIGVYIIVIVALLAIAVLLLASLRVTSSIAAPTLGAVAYIWVGAAIVLAGVIAFFIWLVRKGRP